MNATTLIVRKLLVHAVIFFALKYCIHSIAIQIVKEIQERS